MKRISVIVPVYNAEATLDRCVSSLLAQTHAELELILVDDGSTDGSAAIADAYAAKDARVRAVHTPNRGVSSARNEGLDLFSGDYVGFVDADDWVEPHTFARLLAHAQREQADVVVCGVKREYVGIEPPDSPPDPPAARVLTLTKQQAYQRALETEDFCGYVSNKLFAAGLFSKDGCRIRFDESLHYCEDLVCVCECLYRSRCVVFDPEPLYHYINTQSSACYSLFSERRLSLPAARRKLIELTRRYFPELLASAENLYVTATVFTFLMAVHSGADTAPLRGDLKRIRRYAVPYFFRKGNRFSYRSMALLLSASPRLAAWALRIRFRARG